MFIGQILERAEIIIEGEIVQLGDSTVVIDIKNCLKGSDLKANITIRKYKDWTCAYRWSKYEIGQKAIFGIQKNKNNEYSIVGFGNEGEFPIIDNNVYYITYLSRNIYPELGNEGGYKFTHEEAISGINEYLNKVEEGRMYENKEEVLNSLYLQENKFLEKIIAYHVILNYKKYNLNSEERTKLTLKHMMGN
jgi:hypothetical protein